METGGSSFSSNQVNLSVAFSTTALTDEITPRIEKTRVDTNGIGASDESAEAAVCDLSLEHSDNDKKVTPCASAQKVYDTASDSKTLAAGDSNRCNLIINYLPHDADNDSLHAMFVTHGEITETKVIRQKYTKKSLGYGFVKYVREEDAQAAIELMNGKIWNTKKIKVSFARPQSDDIRNCKLYVSNLPKDMDENAVCNLFEKFGQIIECRVLRHPKDTSISKGVAFVQFNLKIQANNALEMNGYRFPGQSAPLLVKYAEEQLFKGGDSHAIVTDYMYIEGQPFMAGISHSDHSSYYVAPSSTTSAPYHYLSMFNHSEVGHPGITADFHQYPHPHQVRINNRKYVKYSQNSHHIAASNSNVNNRTPVDRYGNLNINAAIMAPSTYFYSDISPQGTNPKTNVHNNFAPRISSPDCQVCIVVKNLPKDCSNAQLHDLFSNFGLVESSRIQNFEKQTTHPTSVGTVIMQGVVNAQYAVAALNGITMANSTRPLQVSISFAKQEV